MSPDPRRGLFTSLFEFLEYRGLPVPVPDADHDRYRTDSQAFVHFWLSSRLSPEEPMSGEIEHILQMVAQALISKYMARYVPRSNRSQPDMGEVSVSVTIANRIFSSSAIDHYRNRHDVHTGLLLIILARLQIIGVAPIVDRLRSFGIGMSQVLGWLDKIEQKVGPDHVRGKGMKEVQVLKMLKWCDKIKSSATPLLSSSAMILEEKKIEALRTMPYNMAVSLTPALLFSETAMFEKGKVYSLRMANLPVTASIGKRLTSDPLHKAEQLSPSLSKLYGVPTFDVCTSVPYSVGSAWARDRIGGQLIYGVEVGDIEKAALLEELFIDPREVAHRPRSAPSKRPIEISKMWNGTDIVHDVQELSLEDWPLLGGRR